MGENYKDIVVTMSRFAECHFEIQVGHFGHRHLEFSLLPSWIWGFAMLDFANGGGSYLDSR